MENQAAKKRIEEDGSMDRISQLARPILHHILCFLSQEDAVRTCLLSKSWRYLGSTRPNLEFREGNFKKNKENKFMSVIDKTLQRYNDQKLSIQNFTLEMLSVHSELISVLKKWIPIVLMNTGLKTFNLSFIYGLKVFDLPTHVFQAEFLEELYLDNCKLYQMYSTDKVLLKRLQTLSLDRVYIADKTFEKIMSGCPLIENVILKRCDGLRTVKVNNAHNNLKHFYCGLDAKDPCVEIDAPTTPESIRIENCWYQHHNSKFFPNLKSLYLYRVRLSTESFDNFSSNNCPCLEDLQLAHCYGLEYFEISSRSIKRLIIFMDLYKSIDAAIDVANIIYFKLSLGIGIRPPSISFSKTLSHEWKSDISVCGRLDSYNDVRSAWFLKFNKILKALSQSQISLEVSHFPSTNQHTEDTCGGFYEPVVVEHLSLRGSLSSSYFPFWLKYLFRVCRPKYIYDADIKWEDENMQTGELLCKILVQERLDCAWPQDSVEVSIEEEEYDSGDGDREELQGTSLSKNNIRFRLKWRELS